MMVQFANVTVSIRELTIGRVVRDADGDAQRPQSYGHVKGFSYGATRGDLLLIVRFATGDVSECYPINLTLY